MHNSTEAARRKMATDSKAARARYTALKQRLISAEAAADAHKAACDVTANRVRSFESEIFDVNSGLTGRLRRSEQALQGLCNRLASSEKALQSLSASARKLALEKDEACRSLSVLRAKAAGDSAQLESFSDRCGALEEALEKEKERCVSLEKALQAMRERGAATEKSISLEMRQALRDQAARSELRYSELFNEHQALQKEHSRLVLALRGVQGELDARKQSDKTRVDATIAHMKSALEQKTQEVHNLRKERNALLRGTRTKRSATKFVARKETPRAPSESQYSDCRPENGESPQGKEPRRDEAPQVEEVDRDNVAQADKVPPLKDTNVKRRPKDDDAFAADLEELDDLVASLLRDGK